MIPKALIDFFMKYWTYMAIGAALLAGVAYVYHLGGAAPRAELKSEQVEHQAEVAKLEAIEERQEFESQAYINQAEKDYEADKNQIHDDWAAWLSTICPGGVAPGGVCNLGPGSDPAPKPVRIDAGVCNDPARDLRLSDALQGYREDVGRFLTAEREQHRSVLAAERAKTAGLLEVAQRQAAALAAVNAYVEKEKAIHTIGADALR